MNRTELTLLVAATFMLAILIGWILRWGYSRLGQAGLANSGNSNELAARLLKAEEDRDAAYRDRDETLADMKKRLVQTEAELSAAMEGLGDARRDAEAMRRELSEMRG